MLDFVQPHLSGSAIDIYEDNEGAKGLVANSQDSRLSKHVDVCMLSSSKGPCEARVGSNSQRSHGGTTHGHPHKLAKILL